MFCLLAIYCLPVLVLAIIQAQGEMYEMAVSYSRGLELGDNTCDDI